jgi:peptidyl-prolyl cis-trans isomerase C
LTIAQFTQPRAFTYHLLRVAIDLFQKNLALLDDRERARVERKARRTFALETLVLSSAEAAEVVIQTEQIEHAVAAVQARYAQVSDFEQDLLNNGLDLPALRTALYRELAFDAVLQKVGARHAAVNDIDIGLFYELHSERFQAPEKRVARHILITVNDDFFENRRDVARARAERIAEQLRGKSGRFAGLARQYSECPTALDGGKLGAVVRGQLYPELDRALFTLAVDQVSDVVETDLGFHLVRCERIEHGKKVPLRQAKPKIRQILEERKRRNCQKAWLAALNS